MLKLRCVTSWVLSLQFCPLLTIVFSLISVLNTAGLHRRIRRELLVYIEGPRNPGEHCVSMWTSVNKAFLYGLRVVGRRPQVCGSVGAVALSTLALQYRIGYSSTGTARAAKSICTGWVRAKKNLKNTKTTKRCISFILLALASESSLASSSKHQRSHSHLTCTCSKVKRKALSYQWQI